MKCPACQEKMEPTTRSEISVEECFYCNGVWVSAGSLEEVCKVPGVRLQKQEVFDGFLELFDQIGERNCPSCINSVMSLKYIDSVEVDYCSECSGLFFEKGEVTSALNLPEDSGLKESLTALEILAHILLRLFT